MSEPKKKKVSRPLYEEAFELLVQQETLKDTVFWQHDQVMKYCEKYPDADIDAMSEEQKIKVLQEADELWARLNQSVKELKLLNEKYEALRTRVRDYYGKDIMPPSEPFMTPGLDEDSEVDMGGTP